MKINCKIFLLIVALILAAKSYSVNVDKTERGIILKSDSTYLQIDVCSPKIIHVIYSRNGQHILPSLSAKDDWSRVSFNVKNEDNKVILSTNALKMVIDAATLKIEYYDNSDNILLKENGRVLAPVNVQGENFFQIKQNFQLTKDEAIYGLGEYQNGVMNWRNHDVLLVQANKIDVNPFLISTNNYGLLWDNYSKTKFHDGSDATWFQSEVADGINYFFIQGDDMDEVISGYRSLTGEAPMFPKWAFGYVQSKERYKNRRELIDVVAEYRKRHIPLDVIVQDWQYWGENDNWSGMIWDTATFPDPKGMIDSLHNFYKTKVMISIWPKVGPKTEIYKELDKKGFLLKSNYSQKVYDAYSPEARDIYWKYIKKGLFDVGIDSWWMDGTEPEFNTSWDQPEFERETRKAGNTALGPIARFLNPYSLLTTKGVYENQRKVSDQKRVLILTRSCFSGQQRYGAITWSGDVACNWDTLKVQIANGLNFSMAGIPYWTSDIGGFFPSGFGGKFPHGVNDDAFKELYLRWFQFGTFCPMFRSHGTGTPREVWHFGDKGTWCYEALVKYINLRYRLLPYIYSTSWKVTNEDYTMMRGLSMDFSKDPAVRNINDEYMFGKSMLIAPVINQMYYEAKKSGEIIKKEFLFNDKGESGGLTGEYFDGRDFKNSKYVGQHEVLDFNWNGSPPRNLNMNEYCIRWTGQLVAPETGEYEIQSTSDDGVRFWFDNKLVINEWKDQPPTLFSFKVKLEKGTKYNIKIEFYQGAGGAEYSLTWKKPSDQLNEIKKEKILGTRSVYLPKNIDWFDFWTGNRFTGGQTIVRETPIDLIPLFIKAGSIIPMGSLLQYSTEKPADTLELRIYPGADGEFNLYEDENDSYNYEKGIYSLIKFNWDDKKNMLTVESPQGKFPGMLKNRIFRFVVVNEFKGKGIEMSVKSDYILKYVGERTVIFFTRIK